MCQGHQSFSSFFVLFVLAKLAKSSIRVKLNLGLLGNISYKTFVPGSTKAVLLECLRCRVTAGTWTGSDLGQPLVDTPHTP